MKAHADHPVWQTVAPELTPRDFRHPHEMDADFLLLLSKARRLAGVPFRIVSDYRPPEQNAAAGGATKSAHMESPCRAVDLRVHNNEERFRIVDALRRVGLERIGIYVPTDWQRTTYGPAAGTIHVDDSRVNPRPRMWLEW